METGAHRALKDIAVAYLRSLGCSIVAREVACPLSKWRLDVAAYWDTLPLDQPAHDVGLDSAARVRARSTRIQPRTVIIECKQSRADFLSDRDRADELMRRRERLLARRTELEDSHVKPTEPELRESRGYLFDSMESWDFSRSRSPSHKALSRELRRLDRRLHGHTKFFMLARYRLADRLYVLAPPRVVKPRELPRGWGLLEVSPASIEQAEDGVIDPSACVAVRRSEAEPSRDARRSTLLRNIAAAATRDAERARRPEVRVASA
ncbi:MAG: hypothetical protein AAGD00_08020 [Planctomycetota bacterium]